MLKRNIIISGLLILFACSTQAQTDKEKVAATVDKSTIQGHIYFIASDELKGRETGTPNINVAARYLSTTLMRYGVKPVPGANEYYQEINFKKTARPTDIRVLLNGTALSDVLSLTANDLEVKGEAIFINHGLKEDYKKASTYKGKVLVALAGSATDSSPNSLFRLSREKQRLAEEAGATALIEFHNFGEAYWNNVKGALSHESLDFAKNAQPQPQLVHLWANVSTLPDLKKASHLELSVTGASESEVSSYNIVGMVEGTDPQLKNEYVIYSAHYDHVGIGAPNAEGDSIYNGARDNAVGTVTVLSAAENIAKYPTRRSALFILFTGEEKGLLGSKYYTQNPLIPLDQMVYCFNSDNASYNDTSVATIVGLNRTTAEGHIKKASEEFGLQAINDPAPEQNLFDRSDNVHFAAKGIPAPTFSLGFTAFDQEVFKYYHQPSDNPDNLDYDYLLKFFSAYVLSCRYIANDAERPFWVEGDKYYEAGKALYGNK